MWVWRRHAATTRRRSRTDALVGDTSSGCGAGVLQTSRANAANGIWSFNDSRTRFDDGNLVGEDPAAFFGGWFAFGDGHAPPSGSYASNRFLHPKCSAGRRMQGSADACVASICAVDPYCCTTAWDASCVDEVGSVCGATCNAGCGASIRAVQSGTLGSGCDGACAKRICAGDRHCCDTQWDAACVTEVRSVCGPRR